MWVQIRNVSESRMLRPVTSGAIVFEYGIIRISSLDIPAEF
jgi:hypothetical protein